MQKYKSAFDAIADTPQEATNFKLRSEAMDKIIEYIKTNKLTQKEAAKILKVTQPRISDLKNGKLDLFTLDTLVGMLALINIEVSLQFKVA
ncbi:MAG: XRE family transcriptional regulator [Gammaproteobacteria bacterium]|nr:XRE family transcriptional regulator [Gammaproteobacteria bacterium]